MKIYLWLSIAIILISSLCLYSIYYINNTAFGVLDTLEPLKISVKAEDWDKAYQNYLISEKEWDTKNNLLHAFIEHRELEQINVIFEDLGYQVESKKLYESVISLIELDHYLHQLMENQQFRMGNIL